MRNETASPAKQVFFDASGRRRYLVASLNWGVSALIGMLALTLVIATLVDPTVPRLIVTKAAPLLLPAQGAHKASPQEPAIVNGKARAATAAAAQQAKRYAHFITWDENSFSSLKRHAHEIDVVVGEWLALSPQGGLQRTHIDKETALRAWIAANHEGVKILPLISNYNDTAKRWEKKLAAEVLASPAKQEWLIREIMAYVLKFDYGGIVLDFEGLDAASSRAYVAFTRQLASQLASFGKTLTVQVSAQDPAYDLSALGKVAHAVIVMIYDEHTEFSKPGPLAGQGWFEQKLALARALVPPHKLIVGIGAYAYDWADNGSAQELSVQEALELLASSQAPLNFESALNPQFGYLNAETGQRHVVWYLDAVTAHNQIAAALQEQIAGLALWRLGTEDQGVWASFGRGRFADASARREIETLRPGYDVLYRGKGEVLHVVDATKDGRRSFRYDGASNLIVSQQIVEHPHSTVVQRYGARDEKLIALTFDDGPDPRYTGRILDILAQKQVKGTFFVVGSAAVVNQQLLRRIYEEGHDIGNHTFTHSNTFEASPEHVRLEFNATQRLIESILGVRTRLSRPPFAKDLEPRTVDAAEVLRVADSLGYWTIGMGIDPKDWYQPISSRIVEKTLASARRGDGQIVLLHDAGGSREATIKALPEMIDKLRADGYRLVATHELLGIPRNDVMPTAAVDNALMASVNRVGFFAISGFNELAHFIFYASVALGALRLLWIGTLAIVHKRRVAKRAPLDWMPASVTAIVPAYNEASVVAKTVRSLLASHYKQLKIIVVDDGSTDGTADIVRQAFSKDARVSVISKPNGGKWSALNVGLAHAEDDIVVMLDADTIFDPDAIGLLVRHFHDAGVGAVCGHAVVGNRVNILTRFQALEYATNQNLDRRALELVNGITVVPGAIGAWRRAALQQIGGYAADTLAEDSDATVRLVRAGWRVVCEPGAVARTEAPETIRQFMKQRLRWMFGTFQVACKNVDVFRHGKPAGLVWFGLPNVLVFQFLFTLMAPIVDLMMVWSILAAFITMPLEAAEGARPALQTVAFYWLAFQLVEIITVILAVALDRRDGIWRLAPLLLVQKFVYRQLLYITAIRVALTALKGTMQGWGKLTRTGNVRLLSSPRSAPAS